MPGNFNLSYTTNRTNNFTSILHGYKFTQATTCLTNYIRIYLIAILAAIISDSVSKIHLAHPNPNTKKEKRETKGQSYNPHWNEQLFLVKHHVHFCLSGCDPDIIFTIWPVFLLWIIRTLISLVVNSLCTFPHGTCTSLQSCTLCQQIKFC